MIGALNNVLPASKLEWGVTVPPSPPLVIPSSSTPSSALTWGVPPPTSPVTAGTPTATAATVIGSNANLTGALLNRATTERLNTFADAIKTAVVPTVAIAAKREAYSTLIKNTRNDSDALRREAIGVLKEFTPVLVDADGNTIKSAPIVPELSNFGTLIPEETQLPVAAAAAEPAKRSIGFGIIAAGLIIAFIMLR